MSGFLDPIVIICRARGAGANRRWETNNFSAGTKEGRGGVAFRFKCSVVLRYDKKIKLCE